MTRARVIVLESEIASHISSAKPIVDRQTELFPIPSVLEFPGVTNTADAWGKVIVANGKSYVVKGEKGTPNARASEMFCADLAEIVGLKCPPHAIIQMTNGDLLFGSEEIVGVADQTETTRILTTLTNSPSAKTIIGLRGLLSSVYAFDLFIHNVDRHDQNFLSLEFHGSRHFFLIDHVQSMFSNWPITDFPPANCHTRVTAAKLRGRHGFDIEDACAMIDRIRGLARPEIMGLMRRIPSEWLRAGFDQEVEGWWGSPAFEARLQRLREELRNGSLL
jgi:hypothetical protein